MITRLHANVFLVSEQVEIELRIFSQNQVQQKISAGHIICKLLFTFSNFALVLVASRALN